MKQFIKKVGKEHARTRSENGSAILWLTLRYYVRYGRAGDRPACVFVCARARGSTYGRRGQTDRDKEHFRTRAGRDQGSRICCCWQGEAQENPRESHTWVPTLPLIRSLPFVSRSLGPARPHASPTELSLSAWPLTLSLSPSRSRRATPHPWGTLSLFFLYFLCPPLVQMARTISRHVVPHGILRERRMFLSIGTIENFLKIVRDCRGKRIE